jgi:DNA-binding NtrC family response regulator
MSKRKSAPHIVVDCGAIVPSLIESELFGHKKGSFTSANEAHKGKFKEADHGTLFLDEIGELPMELQTKLLRFAQEKTFSVVGSNVVEVVDVRLIVATNKDLAEEVEKGYFRKDLFYRLNVFTLHSPNLKQRQHDVLLVADHYLQQFNMHYGKQIQGFTERATRAMLQHDWPGNVRELRNQVMRAVIICQNSYIDAEHLTLREPSHQANSLPMSDVMPGASCPITIEDKALAEVASTKPLSHNQQLMHILNECITILANVAGEFVIGHWLESELIQLAKTQGKGNISQSARILALPESTLRRRLDTLQSVTLPNELLTLYPQIIESLKEWLDTPNNSQLNRISQLKYYLCEQSVKHSLNRQRIAQLVGVSEPTLRKILATAP